MPQLIDVQVVDDIVARVAELAARLDRPDPGAADEVGREFGWVLRAVEAVPPTVADAGLMCYLRNRVRSSRDLAAGGEPRVAAYQLREAARKLATRAADERVAAGPAPRKN